MRSCLPGIGKSIATRLAQQGLSVVLVALQNEALDATFEELSTEYPKVEFRKVRSSCGSRQVLCVCLHSAVICLLAQVVNSGARMIHGLA